MKPCQRNRETEEGKNNLGSVWGRRLGTTSGGKVIHQSKDLNSSHLEVPKPETYPEKKKKGSANRL